MSATTPQIAILPSYTTFPQQDSEMELPPKEDSHIGESLWGLSSVCHVIFLFFRDGAGVEEEERRMAANLDGALFVFNAKSTLGGVICHPIYSSAVNNL